MKPLPLQFNREKKVLIVAHGNSLRALVKYLDKITDEEIVGLNIPTGVPLVYELDHDLTPIKHYYLGDPEAICKKDGCGCRAGNNKRNQIEDIRIQKKKLRY